MITIKKEILWPFNFGQRIIVNKKSTAVTQRGIFLISEEEGKLRVSHAFKFSNGYTWKPHGKVYSKTGNIKQETQVTLLEIPNKTFGNEKNVYACIILTAVGIFWKPDNSYTVEYHVIYYTSEGYQRTIYGHRDFQKFLAAADKFSFLEKNPGIDEQITFNVNLMSKFFEKPREKDTIELWFRKNGFDHEEYRF